MLVTHFGHACVVVDIDGTRLLFDPGSLSAPGEAGGDVDAILLTHSHADHLDVAAVRSLVTSNPSAPVVADADSAGILDDAGIAAVHRVDSVHGIDLDVAGIAVEATTVPHATIHCDLPGLDNNAYVVAGSVLHPGDAFFRPNKPVDVLLLPIGGPWMKLSEAVDYLRSVAPSVAIPIHQGGLAAVHRGLHGDLLRKLGPSGTEIRVLTEGEPTSI